MATSTVAAGVNLPARAVVVRDTQVGFDTVDTATVLQMFGRAGRVGAGEPDGWAFLVVDEHEYAHWQARLTAGYRVESRIHANLPEQLLSEVVRERVTARPEADEWWGSTLAHHQGSHGFTPLRQAVGFLRGAGLVAAPAGPGGEVVATELGRLTARLMISPTVGDDVRHAVAELPLPSGPDEAERLLIGTLATVVPNLAQVVAGDGVRPAVARILASQPPVPGRGQGSPTSSVTPGSGTGDLARASLLACVGPGSDGRAPVGLPYAAMFPVLEEAPRYLHWLSGQGALGTVPPWCAVVAADLGRRIRWRRLRPPRGAGRLLWMLEQMAAPADLERRLPDMWQAALARGYRSPDWPPGRPPTGCGLDDRAYAALLRDRATDYCLDEYPPHAWVTGPAGGVVVTWRGARWQALPMRRGTAEAPYPESGESARGAAVFTRRGDYRATSWLSAYAAMAG